MNSRRPSGPWIRPNPESPTPPKGSDGIAAKLITLLIEVIPERICSAISMPRAFENTVDPRPYLEALVRSMASSTVLTFVIVMVGPNVSSCTASESSGTSTRIVGCT